MSLDKLLVSIGGLGLIGFVWWFFFGKKDEMMVSGNNLEILVDGGYHPSIIKVNRNQKITLSLIRKDKNSCLEEFILPDFKISKYLPLNEKVNVVITPKKQGEYSFHCGMNMFHGKVVVV